MTKCFLMAFCLPFCLKFKGGKDESGQVPRFVFTGRPAAVSAYCIFGRNKPVKNEIQGLVDKSICTAACLPNFRFRKKSVLFDGLFCFIIERLYFVPWCSFRFFPQPVCCWPWSRDAVLHLEHFSKLFFCALLFGCLGGFVVTTSTRKHVFPFFYRFNALLFLIYSILFRGLIFDSGSSKNGNAVFFV